MIPIFFLAFLVQFTSGQYLSVVGGKNFSFNGKNVHLSGVNIAWNAYGYDFGNGQYANSGPVLEKWIREIAAAGANSIRIWIHIQGENTPAFNADGYITGPDNTGTLISDLTKFLSVAQQNNLFVIPVLWSGAVLGSQRFINLIWDDSKLDSYINNALIPLVNALKGSHAVAAWEIMNEPEGSVAIVTDTSNPCFDTNKLSGSGAGWTGANVPIYNLLRFINRQAAAIKGADPKALITVGTWSELSATDAFSNSYNYYKDQCLQQAGGESSGVLDFHEIHTYSWQGNWNAGSPFKHQASDFQLTKPLVIGEFAASCSANEGVDALWIYSYNKGYAGAWSWQYNAGGDCSDTAAQQVQGLSAIRNYSNNGVISVQIP